MSRLAKVFRAVGLGTLAGLLIAAALLGLKASPLWWFVFILIVGFIISMAFLEPEPERGNPEFEAELLAARRRHPAGRQVGER